MQQAGPPGLGQELGAEPDQAARGDDVLHPDPAGAVVDHLLQPALAQRQQLDQHALVVARRVDRQALHRLVQLAVDQPGDDLRLADGQLEAFAAHDLDEDRELQLAAALHLPGVRALGRQHPDRDVADELGVEPVLHQPRGELLAALAGQRRGVDADGHRDARLVDRDDRQRPRVVGVGDRLADRDLRDARDRDDVARARRSSIGTRSRASVPSSSVSLTRSTVPSCRHHATVWPFFR